MTGINVFDYPSPFGNLRCESVGMRLRSVEFAPSTPSLPRTRNRNFTNILEAAWTAQIPAEEDFRNLNSMLLIHGDDRELEVWKKLLTIRFGQTVSYSELARQLGSEYHPRAVARILSRNQFAMIIPCHRVIMKNGLVGGYRWGQDRKEALIKHEKEEVCSEREEHIIRNG